MSVPKLCYTDQHGQHVFALDAPSTTLGRSQTQDVVLGDKCVSRQHAVILREGAQWVLADQGSSHGTYVNGAKVQRVVLNAGDVVQLGSIDSVKLRFHLEAGAELDSTLTSFSELLSSMTVFGSSSEAARPAGREIEQLNWLLGAARQLNAGGAIADILTTLLRLTLQLTGVERGFVFLREGDAMTLARGLSVDGRVIDEDSTVSRRAIQKAIESESKFSISDTLADENVSAWASVMVNKIRSIYCIPLRKRDTRSQQVQLLGLLYLDSQIGVGKLSEIDHQLLDTIATEAAALLHNALLAEEEAKSRRAREELAVAAVIHGGLMSISLPVIPYAVIQAKSVPCLEIGGDFYDAVVLDDCDCVCVSIADVSGKGVPAAIVAATLQGIIHAQLLSRQGLAKIAALVNQFLCNRNVGKYATMVLLKLFRDGTVEFVNCGHIPPVLVDGAHSRQIDEGNMVVGLFPSATYTAMRVQLQPGQRILLATDGLIEAENSAGESFGEDGLRRIAHEQDLGSILNHVARFQAPNQAEDDCTLVDIRYTGVGV
jgi:serine phosphatase RsbU (regulator of sigma subunit)